MYDLAGRYGWTHEDFSGTVGRIGFSDVPGVPSAGIWCHLDVVPVPDPADWVYPPFQGTEVEGRCLIGRGIQDNKMPAIGVFHVMNCLRDLGFRPRRSWSLYLGTSEENGMDDVRWYAARHPCPDLNLVPDTGFPVCTAQRGCQILRYRIPFPHPAAFRCGSDISVTPEHIIAELPSGKTLRTEGHCFHVMKADDDNAVIRMLGALAEVFGNRGDALLSLRDLLSSEEAMEMGVTADTFFPVSPF